MLPHPGSSSDPNRHIYPGRSLPSPAMSAASSPPSGHPALKMRQQPLGYRSSVFFYDRHMFDFIGEDALSSIAP